MRKILISALVVLSLSSCSGFLNLTPKHNWTVDEAMTTYEKAVQSVNGIYPEFVYGDPFNGAFNVGTISKSGLVITSTTDSEMTYTQTSGGNANLWSVLFQSINAANLAITGIPNIPESAFPTATTATELIAEARFLRGWFNSIQLLHFCKWYDADDSPYGIIDRQEVTNVSNRNNPRITVGESWARVFEDIDFGIENMNDSFNRNKVSKTFAKIIKAKILLIRGTELNNSSDLSTALTLVNEVLNAIPSGLQIEPHMREMYLESWDNKENVFARYLEDNSSRTAAGGYWTTYGFGYNVSSPEATPEESRTYGLKYGTDWIIPDPRFSHIVGLQRAPETWDTSYEYTWDKIYRQGSYAGKQDPIDEKYTTYYLRLPEVYIMKAELLARTGAPIGEVMEVLNTYRRQRTDPILPDLTASNTDTMWDLIFKEYVMETILENDAVFFASLRIMKDGQRMIEVMKEGVVFNKEVIQWPVPDAEIVNNPLVVQNPGQE